MELQSKSRQTEDAILAKMLARYTEHRDTPPPIESYLAAWTGETVAVQYRGHGR